MEFTGEHSAFWGLGESKYPDSEDGMFLQHCWRPLAGTVPVCVFLGWREKEAWHSSSEVTREQPGLCSNLSHEGRQFWNLAAAFGLHTIRSLCYPSEKAWWGAAHYQCFQEQQDLVLCGHQGHEFIPLKCDIRMFGVLWEDSILEALELNRPT